MLKKMEFGEKERERDLKGNTVNFNFTQISKHVVRIIRIIDHTTSTFIVVDDVLCSLQTPNGNAIRKRTC